MNLAIALIIIGIVVGIFVSWIGGLILILLGCALLLR